MTSDFILMHLILGGHYLETNWKDFGENQQFHKVEIFFLLRYLNLVMYIACLNGNYEVKGYFSKWVQMARKVKIRWFRILINPFFLYNYPHTNLL